MALTIRLNQHEVDELDNISFKHGQATASGTIKYMIANFQAFQEEINTLEVLLKDSQTLVNFNETKLQSLASAMSMLNSLISKPDPEKINF